MPMLDDIARLDAARRSRNWEYQWWEPKDAVALLDYLQGRLKETGDGGQLRCYRGLNEQGMEVLWFTVHNGDSLKSHEGFNISHPCPPLCGDG